MRRTTLTAALGLAIVLAGCSADGSGTGSTADDTAGGTTSNTQDNGSSTEGTDGGQATQAAPMDDPVCAAFFQTGPVTLAERAVKDRDVLAAGETLDPASWGEISLLNQRIVELGGQAQGDQAALLERINAPFAEATDAVLNDKDQSPTDAEITVPQIDVSDAAAAQDELESACAG